MPFFAAEIPKLPLGVKDCGQEPRIFAQPPDDPVLTGWIFAVLTHVYVFFLEGALE